MNSFICHKFILNLYNKLIIRDNFILRIMIKIIFLIISILFFIQKKKKLKYKTSINVAYAFDQKYLYITHISMKSIMISQKNDTFIIFYILLSSNLPEDKKNIIDLICKDHLNCNINYYYMGEKFKNLNVKGITTWSTEMYYRLILQDLLPNESRILYLDCDTLIYKDLSKIYNYNIDGKYYTGMLEPMDKSLPIIIDNFINTGVMLINLEELRKGNATKKVEKFLIQNNYKLKFPVNDAINSVFHEKNGYFNPEFVQWGFCNSHFINNYINSLIIKLDKNEVLKAYKDPYIYHLIGYWGKPWKRIPYLEGFACIDPLTRFYEIARKTNYYFQILEKYKIHK